MQTRKHTYSVHTYIHTYILTNTYSVHTYKHTYIYTYTYIIHTYTHTCIQINTLPEDSVCSPILFILAERKLAILSPSQSCSGLALYRHILYKYITHSHDT